MKKLLFTVLMACLCFCGFAQTIDPDLALEMSHRGDNEKIKVHIIMKAKPDQAALLRQADYYVNQEERRVFVVNELKEFATASQFDLQNALREMQRSGMVANVHSNWIANMIACEATKAAINDMARRNDVEIIGYNADKNWIPDGEEAKPVSTTREITQNVTQVNADDVWALGYTGQGVVVAVIDTGVNYNHVDVADHLWDGGAEFPHHGYDVINHDNDPMDDMGHGSHCAGTVCGDGTAGKQTGMAPDATLMCVKCLDASGNGNATNISDGIQWAVEHGCNLFSMSLGIANSTVSERTLLRHTCVNALTAGVVAAIAAGNEGDMQWMYPVPNNVRVPGSCPPPYMDPDQAVNPGELSCSVCIGAVDYNDNAAYFTSRGPVTWTNTEFGDYAYNPGIGLIRPDVCAPGVDIISLNYATNNGYTSMSGTSMATPCAAGVMCLLLSKNINTTPADICRILEETALPKSDSKSNTYGFGRIDVLAAIEQIQSGAFAYASHSINDAQGNNNGKANPGENISLTLALQNVSESTVNNATVVLSSDDQYITVSENTATITTAASGQIVTLDDAFAFTVAENAPANHTVRFSAEISIDGESDGKVNFSDVIFDYNLAMGAVAVLNDDNGNGLLEPGENADLRILIDNTGNELAQSVMGLLTTDYQYATLTEPEKSFSTIGAEMTGYADYNVTLDAAAPADFVIPFNLLLTDANGRETELTFNYKNACNVIFELHDSYGDGWQGNYLQVSYSDGTPSEQMTVQSGSSATFTRELASGVHVTVVFHTGSWSNECSYTISYQDGTQIFAGTTNDTEFDVNCSGGGSVPTFCEPIGELTANVDGLDVVLAWEAPEEGTPTGYEVYRDTKLLDVVTELTYTDAEVAEGLYNYCVYAVYDDCQSEFVCTEVEVSACSGVNNLSIHAFENYLAYTWDEPTDPTDLIEYQIYLNDELLAATNETAYTLDELEAGDYHFCVRAIYPECEKDVCDDFCISETVNWTHELDGRMLSMAWEPAVDAAAYEIVLDNETVAEVTETSYTLELSAGTNLVAVYPVDGCISFDANVEICVCDPATELTVDLNAANQIVATWTAPSEENGVEGYYVYVNGELFNTVTETTAILELPVGESNVCVVAFSANCQSAEICASVFTCEGVTEYEIGYVGNEFSMNWTPVDVENYTISIDGESVTVESPTHEYSCNLSEGEHHVSILANREDCLTAAAVFVVSVFTENPVLEVTDIHEGYIKLGWNVVDNAIGYVLSRDGEIIAMNVVDTEYTDTEMAINAEHCYQVSAIYLDGVSTGSNQACARYFNDLLESSDMVNVFPNPTTDKLNIECEGMTGIEVYSVEGKCILNIEVEGDSYQLDGLNSGVYMLRVFKGNESIARKVVKF